MTDRCADVWYGARRVGVLDEPERGQLRLAYDEAWLDTGFPISLRLPLTPGPQEAFAFFAGLLPEARTRERILRQRKLRHDDDFGLLLQIGRDCAGALSVLPPGEDPALATVAPTPLSSDEFRRLVESRGQVAPATSGPIRFSLAGAQEKTAAIVEGERVSLPNHAYPSNTIIKFQTMPWVCFAELTATELARKLGHAVPRLTFHSLDDHPYLFVERFDRVAGKTGLQRLHQEDMTQALGLTSGEKYESDGGPSLAVIADLLRRHAAQPGKDLERLRDWQILNYLMGNFDGHAKNLSLLYEPDNPAPRLAPFYDLVCIDFMNRIGASQFERSLAFAIGENSHIEQIRRRDWEQWAKQMGWPARAVTESLEQMATTLPQLAREVRESFAQTHGDNQVYERFEEVVRDRCRWVLNQRAVR